MPPSVTSRIADNLAAVRQRIADAAKTNGREPGDVLLVAVTKYVEPQLAEALFQAGCHDLAESRPQELWRKAETLASHPVHWHLIGKLQRNKIRRTLPLVSLIHSVDSLKVAQALNEEASQLNRRVPVLLEANVSADATKHGFEPEAIEPALLELAQFEHLEIRGLMAMSGVESDADQTRREFGRTRELRDQLRLNSPPGVDLRELSMGMSGDFETAIAEGATIVRVGSALFEGLDNDPA